MNGMHQNYGVYKTLGEIDYKLSKASSVPVVGTLAALSKVLFGTALIASGLAAGILGSVPSLAGHHSLIKHTIKLMAVGGLTIDKGLKESLMWGIYVDQQKKLDKDAGKVISALNIEDGSLSRSHTVTEDQSQKIKSFFNREIEPLIEERNKITNEINDKIAKNTPKNSKEIRELRKKEKAIKKEQDELTLNFKKDNDWYMARPLFLPEFPDQL